MKLTTEQETAVAKVRAWLATGPRDRRPWFYLAGYAGTGKTTIAKLLAAEAPDRVEFGAPTGKAAQVMRRSGCEGATTVHRLIYRVSERGRAQVDLLAELVKAEQERINAMHPAQNPRLEKLHKLEADLRAARAEARRPVFGVNPDAQLRGASLLVLDECSMADERLARDVLSFGVPVLALGDPAQLPPVRGGGYFTSVAPDAVLTEVRRQALDSPVLRLATAVRNGHPKALEFGQIIDITQDGNDSIVKRYEELTLEDCQQADVILTGHNVTRRAFNCRLRELDGHRSEYPVKGEPLIALNNRHDLGIYNGTMLEADSDAAVVGDNVSIAVTGDDIDPEPIVVESSRVAFDRHRNPDLVDDSPGWERRERVDLDWAYALTVHKAQGSQWPTVVLADDGFLSHRHADRQRWLYTAITRAERRVIVGLR